MTNNDVFELVKQQNINIKEFLENHYQYIWKKDKTVCPFHGDDEKNPNLSYNSKTNTVKCWVCNVTGDLINFVVQKENFEKLDFPKVEAAKFILDKLNIPYLRTTTNELTEEQRAKLTKENEERKRQREEKIKLAEEEERKNREKTIKRLTIKAPILSEYLNENMFEDFIIKNMEQIFILNNGDVSLELSKWMNLYTGWDTTQNSFAILNRDFDKCYNIKHREKYEWDNINKKFLTTRIEKGKWVSASNASIFPFPLEYFKTHKEDEPIIITEGEKDALNLLSYGINCLTLGGVSTEWKDYKYLLQNRKVYIWFDNDKGGYIGAIERYLEIKEVTNEVYITLFYDLNNALPNKYDISDYLKDRKFNNKDEIFHSIAYASYKLTTTKIEEIEEFIGVDLKKYYFNQPIKTFEEIKKEWIKTDTHGVPVYITPVKGEKDIKGLGAFYDKFVATKKETNFEKAKSEIFQEVLPKFAKEEEVNIDNLINMFDEMFRNYNQLHKNYSQTHLSDMVESFELLAKRTDHTFGKYNSKLCIWTGTHYQLLEEEDDISRFLLKNWMPMAWVDKKKISAANVNKILEDIYMGAENLNAIKKEQKNKRVINLTNGTLFVTNKGKITFKSVHTKKDGATNILDFAFDKNATCPKWDKFLNRVLPNKKDQQTLMEYIGYCFLPSHDYESFILLYGKSGSNGKSVIMDIVKSFFGATNVSNLQLQDFEGHQLHSLNNKIINMGSEIDTKSLNKGQLQKLKNIVSPEDSLEINPKMKDPYEMDSKSKPKLWFAVNDKPTVGMDSAVFRRTLFLNFQSEIKDDEKIRGLSKRFDDEKPGILNQALTALKELIKNGKFTKSENMIEDLEAYKDEVSPLRRYAKDCLTLDKDSMIPKKYLYAHYKEYAGEKGYHPLSEQKFWTKLADELGIVLESAQYRVNVEALGDRPRFAIGIFCNKTDIETFDFDKKSVSTTSINFDVNTKTILLKEDSSLF